MKFGFRFLGSLSRAGGFHPMVAKEVFWDDPFRAHYWARRNMKNMQTSNTERPNDILDELHALVTKAEKLISNLAKTETEAGHSLPERLRESREQLSEVYAGAKSQITAGVKNTHEAIRANPYQSLAIAAGVGVLIGIFASRSACSRG
jgi:ElaB/YqjD/DUF883 family membrane-anchored ribosome-binding protein